MRILCTLGPLSIVSCGEVIFDDYRLSWAVIEGSIVTSTGAPASFAELRATPLTPAFAYGDTVQASANGVFAVRIEAFGVSSFRADVRIVAIATNGQSLDTVFRSIHVAESDRARPDTLRVLLTLRQ